MEIIFEVFECYWPILLNFSVFLCLMTYSFVQELSVLFSDIKQQNFVFIADSSK